MTVRSRNKWWFVSFVDCRTNFSVSAERTELIRTGTELCDASFFFGKMFFERFPFYVIDTEVHILNTCETMSVETLENFMEAVILFYYMKI